MDSRNAIELAPAIRHLVGQWSVSCQFQEEELRVKGLAVAVLIDLLNVESSLWTQDSRS